MGAPVAWRFGSNCSKVWSNLIHVIEPVNITEARARFSELLKRVEMGEEIVIAKAGKPIARLVPFRARPALRKAGTAKGLISISPDFDEPLPNDC